MEVSMMMGQLLLFCWKEIPPVEFNKDKYIKPVDDGNKMPGKKGNKENKNI